MVDSEPWTTSARPPDFVAAVAFARKIGLRSPSFGLAVLV